MQTEQLFIPDDIKVGFQNRQDTYTKKLGYITYIDKKGVLRKEKSWEGWRDKKIKPLEVKNEPTEGFVLNKNIGGRSWGWHDRIEKVRCFDPRNFEFEISIPNLLFILKECDCSRGKGLEGKFVYAWSGTELILLPVNCQDYQNCKQFTDLQGQKILAKDLIPGATYTTKKQEFLSFLGKFDYFTIAKKGEYCSKKDGIGKTKKYVFWSQKNKTFIYLNDLTSLAVCSDETVIEDFAKLVDKYYKSKFGSRVVEIFLKDIKPSKEEDEEWFTLEEDGSFLQHTTHWDTVYNHDIRKYTKTEIDFVSSTWKYSVQENGLLQERVAFASTVDDSELNKPEVLNEYPFRHYRRLNGYTIVPWVKPTNKALYVKLESGSKFKVDHNYLYSRD